MRKTIMGFAVLLMSVPAMAENPLLGKWSFERYECESLGLVEPPLSQTYTKEDQSIDVTASENNMETVRVRGDCAEKFTETYSIEGTTLSRTLVAYSNEGICEHSVPAGLKYAQEFSVVGEELRGYLSGSGSVCKEGYRFSIVFKRQP